MTECLSCKRLQQRIDSYGDAVVQLEAKIKLLTELNQTLEAEKRQWTEEKIKQQMIIQQQLGNSDDVVSQLQDEIRRIKKKYNIKD